MSRMDEPSPRTTGRRFLGASIAGILLLGVGVFVALMPTGAPAAPEKSPAESGLANKNLLGLTYQPLPKWVPFESKDTVQKWIDESDTRSMLHHAWQLWGGLTESVTEDVGGTKYQVPLFETWFDESQVFSPPALKAEKSSGRKFSRPRQLFHRSKQLLGAEAAPAPAPPVDPLDVRVVTVKYNEEMFSHVQSNQYYSGAVLQKINNSWGNTPLADRNLKPFPDRSVMLKPVYQLISGDEATLLGYWAGQDKRVDQSQPPGPGNWSEKMLVIPPKVARVSIRGIPTVSLDRFYSVQLTQAEADYVNANFGPQTPAKAGDYAILTGMHVSTREIDNWTWQTYWWSMNPPAIPEAVKSRIKPPFDNYEVQVGYSYMEGPAKGAKATEGNPNSLPVVCFNPYLEAGFGNSTFAPFKNQLGIESNCMTCHRAAAFGDNALYVSNGIVRPGDPVFFTGNTKTDFSWGQALVQPTSTPPK